jgi:hypothetical protein
VLKGREVLPVLCVFMHPAHIGFALNGELIKSRDELESVKENGVTEYLG